MISYLIIDDGHDGTVDAVAEVDDDVNAGEGRVDTGLGKVELADLQGDTVGEVGGGGEGGAKVEKSSILIVYRL